MQKKWAYLLLTGLGVLTLALASTLPGTYFDYDFDKFFKPSDPATAYFETHRQTFGTDNDFVLVGLVSKDGVFNQPFYEKLAALTEALASTPHVIEVRSPSNIKIPVREPLTGSIFQRPILGSNPEKDSLQVFSNPALIDNFFSRDTTAVSILLLTSQGLSKQKSDEMSAGLYSILDTFEFDGVHVGGRAIGQVVYINKIQGEFAIFMLIAIGFVVVLLYFMFRSFRGIVLPLVTVLLAVVWSIGILNLSGSGIGILLNMLPPVIFVVGMSDAVHLYARYLEELKRGHSQRYALRQMTFDTGLATLLTSITTAIGFASLYFTGIPTLQEFGLLTAAGVLAAFVIAITMMPAWLSLTTPPAKALTTKANLYWDTFLENLFPKVIHFRKPLIIGMAVITAIFALSSTQLGLNNFLLEDLKPKEKLRQDFSFFDQYFAGVRPFELGIKLKNTDEDFFNAEHLQALEKLQLWLPEHYGVAALNSPVSVIKSINQTYNGGRSAYYKLPEAERDWNTQTAQMQKMHQAGKLSVVLDSTATYARVFGRAGDWGAQEFEKRNAALQTFISEEGLDKQFDISISGTGTLIDRTNQNLVYSLAKGLGVAFALISLIMGLMFRSIRMVAIALIPNILPLLAVASVMYYLGIDLKMSTSIIFTIAFGIAVDDTIHLLSRYKLELIKGRVPYLALRNAFVHTGKALIITSIILFGGFISLCFSSFQSTFYIGLLVTLTLGFALLFDLSLLPALMSYLPDNGSSLDPSADEADNDDEQTYS